MKKLIVLLLIVAFNHSVFAQGSKIEFKAEDNTIDYGRVEKNSDDGVRAFEFTNTGDEPLIIINAESSCGCTVPSFPKEPIMPGKTGKIEVKYNMSIGPIRKTITVESNATNYEEGRIALKIKGEVYEKEVINYMEKKKALPLFEN